MKKQLRISEIRKRRLSDMIYSSFNKLRQKINNFMESEFQNNNEMNKCLPEPYNYLNDYSVIDEDVYSDMDGIGFDLYGNPIKCF